MDERPTPGQVAYERYMRVRFGPDARVPASRAAWVTPWDWLTDDERRAWEIAAQAARCLWRA